uniref:Protein kinase C and casein kinase substrate in neurons 2 n=1 Tax=Sinocyclocheilus grahami TaxID=75366 RepID=A0A672KHD4_SINGR
MSDLTYSLVDVSSDSFWEVRSIRLRVLSVSSPLGPQYGTVERAWFDLMTEAEKVSDLHMEVKPALMGEDLEKAKNWQKDAYHKQMIGGFKETKEAEDGFRKAQKPWAKKLKEVRAQQLHTVSKHELNTVRKRVVQLAKAFIKYGCVQLICTRDCLVCHPQTHCNDEVFKQWQHFEDKRLRFFREQHLDLSSNHKYSTVRGTQRAVIRRVVTLTSSSEAACLNPFDEDEDGAAQEQPGRCQTHTHLPASSLSVCACVSAAAGFFQVPVCVSAWLRSHVITAGVDVQSVRGRAVFTMQGRALYDYDGQERDELSFRAG